MTGARRLLPFAIGIIAVLPYRLPAAATGGLSGQVEDASGHPLANAEVRVQSESTGARWRIPTDDNGRYQVAGLAPGRYKVTARLPGFRTVSRVGAALESGETARIDFVMELLGLHELITVESGRDALNPAAASSLLLTRDSPGATLPANGGDYRVLFDLAPGVVITPAAQSDAGQFTANGQRPNANTFRVDGVSANTGIGSSILPGAFPVASLPAMTAIGSTENLVSNETAQSVELRPTDFSPEFSNRPGAEALVNTRSGSNSYHAEFFGHVRDNGWTARDWFANGRAVYDFPRPSYNRVGLDAGGPILRNRTFFFISAEEAQLTDTGIQLTSVPSLEARQTASGPLQQVLSYYPAPIGPDLGGGQAVGLLTSDTSAQLVSASARLDQSLGNKGNLFVRLVESPSRLQSGGTRTNWASGTLGLTLGGSGGAIHDLRLGYSRADLLSSWFGGGPTFADAVFGLAGLFGFNLLPNGVVEYYQNPLPFVPSPRFEQPVFGLSVPGLGQFISYGNGGARQDQFEVRETFTKTMWRHEFRAGVDSVRLHPSRAFGTSAVLGAAPSLEGLLENQPLAVTVSSPAQNGRIYEISAFAQDTYRLGDRLSLLYGLGWEITPPTHKRRVDTFSGFWTGSDWQNAYDGDVNPAAPWPVRWRQIAPRLAMAYRLSGGLVLRAGAGAFYDGTLGAAVNPINGAPFNSWLLTSGGTLSGIATNATGTAAGSQSPDVQRFLAGSYPALRLPTSYQWRLAVEKQLGPRGSGSIAYVGAKGRNLLGHEAYVDPATGILWRRVTLTTNSSIYEALEMRYSGSVTRNVTGSLSYTWSHSIDDGSLDSSEFLIHPGFRLSEARASSNFDVRQSLAASLSYRVPFEGRSSPLPPWLAGWTVSGIFRVRSGFPVNVLADEQPLGQGFDNVGRPDRVSGVPAWIADPSAPGGRRVNPAAFAIPPAGATGTLGRNAITGNPLAQMDVSLRREFAIVHGLSLEVGLNVFNVLNHPAFADPVPFLSSPWFGQSTSMQNLMLGSGSANTGLPPLFQNGGPRSAELSFRVSF
jgi:Carboxypeptidase regulatory-like domain